MNTSIIDADELRVVVEKIVAHEASNGDWARGVLLAADVADLGGDFSLQSAFSRYDLRPFLCKSSQRCHRTTNIENDREIKTGDGSLENRLRFTTETLVEIQKRVGPDFLVGLRLVADEQEEGAIDAEEGRRIATCFRDSGLVDFLNVIRGQVFSDARMPRVIPLNCLAEVDDVRGESPDVVVIATGGIPGTPLIPGADLGVSAWDVLTGDVQPAGDVLIWDEIGRAHV